ncbi:hypothetical protein [Aquamicrobium ahrensii]|uniref:Uncharacterized protein n=1 Tax=Aquamicrobium ahrensii TaxID=469551 RepID=A0ABV2KN86_9HYPH
MTERPSEMLRLESGSLWMKAIGCSFGRELFAGEMPTELMVSSHLAQDHHFPDSSLSLVHAQ